MRPRSVTIVGASLAGLRAAETLRREGFEGKVTMIGEEPHLPYDRPPLSKQVLAARRLSLSDGSEVDVDSMVIATGSRCRRPTGADHLDGVHVLGEEIGGVCADLHREHGVDLRTRVGVAAIEGAKRVESVVLTDGSRVPAEVVVVSIGVMPNTDWLTGSGPTIDDGVLCDETCRAAPGVVAAGDVARWRNRRFGEVMRVEHWDNAGQQGAHTARRLLAADGRAEPFTPVPWFWSDQYDRKIQMAGRVRPEDERRIVTGSFAEHRFAVLFSRAGQLTGVVGFNRPRHVMRYKSMVEDGVSFQDAVAADV